MKKVGTKGTTEYSMSILPKRNDDAYVVGLRQWQRLKNDVEKIPQGFNWWTVTWSVSFGVFTAFLGVALTSKEYTSWYWSLTAIFFICFVVTLFCSIKISKITGSSRSNVLSRMHEVEEDHEDPLSGSNYSEKSKV